VEVADHLLKKKKSEGAGREKKNPFPGSQAENKIPRGKTLVYWKQDHSNDRQKNKFKS